MDLQISAKHMELTDSLRNHITERMGRIKKYSDSKLKADVHIGVEKYRNHIHATVKGKGPVLNSEAQDPDSMYKAIDLCVEKLEKQLRRGKMAAHHEKKVGREKVRQDQIAEEVPPLETEDEILNDMK